MATSKSSPAILSTVFKPQIAENWVCKLHGGSSFNVSQINPSTSSLNFRVVDVQAVLQVCWGSFVSYCVHCRDGHCQAGATRELPKNRTEIFARDFYEGLASGGGDGFLEQDTAHHLDDQFSNFLLLERLHCLPHNEPVMSTPGFALQ